MGKKVVTKSRTKLKKEAGKKKKSSVGSFGKDMNSLPFRGNLKKSNLGKSNGDGGRKGKSKVGKSAPKSSKKGKR